MKKIRTICFAFAGWLMASSFSPILIIAQTNELGFGEYMSMVAQNHPVSRQADLLSDESEAMFRRSSGVLDPSLYANVEQKYFRDENYFRFIDGNFKVPTRYGVELNAGYDLNDGVNLNPSDLLPSSGLLHVGVKVDVLSGLLFNERAAALEQAELFGRANAFEQQIMLNDLFLRAGGSFIDWQVNQEKEDLARQFVELSRELLEGTRKLYQVGDGRAIDTLEARINLDARKNEVLTIRADVMRSRLVLGSYLWNEDGEPLLVSEETSPINIDPSLFRSALDSVMFGLDRILSTHPRLNKMANQIESLEVEERLLKEDLKPRLSVQYNPFIYQWDERAFNDYKWKVGFQMPLLFREARGALQLNRIKTEQVELKLKDQENRMMNYVRALYNELLLLEQRIDAQKSIVNESERLATAERTNFQIGESTIFLVNQREQRWFGQRVKLIEMKGKLLEQRMKLMSMLNLLPDMV